MSGGEEKSEQEHKKLNLFSVHTTFISIKRVITRKFVKFHVVVVQQQRQRNVQKKRDAQEKLSFY